MSQIGENVYPNTTFPDAIQTLPTFTDLSSIDQVNYINYLKAMVAGDITTANTYLNQITNTALINANKLNIIADTIRAIQDTYQSSTALQDVIDDKQAEWQDIINKFSYIGEWQEPEEYISGKPYNNLDFVFYQNKIWRCKGTNVMTPPSEGIYWKQVYLKNSMISYTEGNIRYLYIASKDVSSPLPPYFNHEWIMLTLIGPVGNNGQGFNFYGEWDATVEYNMYQMVAYEGRAYVSLQDENLGHIPSERIEWWYELFKTSMTPIAIQSDAPENQNIDDLWFQLV